MADRAARRDWVIETFRVDRMVDKYELAYQVAIDNPELISTIARRIRAFPVPPAFGQITRVPPVDDMGLE
jgi:hypothetical protein